MPTRAMWQRVAARQKRELPSLVDQHQAAALADDEVRAGDAGVGLEVLCRSRSWARASAGVIGGACAEAVALEEVAPPRAGPGA